MVLDYRFNCPGTAFRHEASSLGLSFQTRPPYYVLRTPTLNAADIFDLLAVAQEIFALEFDAPAGHFGRGPAEQSCLRTSDAGWTVFGHSFHSFHDRGLCKMNTMKLVTAIDSIGSPCCGGSYTT